jgi:hypothetical protein
MRGFFAALRMTNQNEQRQKGTTEILSEAQNDDRGGLGGASVGAEGAARCDAVN